MSPFSKIAAGDAGPSFDRFAHFRLTELGFESAPASLLQKLAAAGLVQQRQRRLLRRQRRALGFTGGQPSCPDFARNERDVGSFVGPERDVVLAFRQDGAEVGHELAGPRSVLVQGDLQFERSDDGGQEVFRIDDRVFRAGNQNKNIDLKMKARLLKFEPRWLASFLLNLVAVVAQR